MGWQGPREGGGSSIRCGSDEGGGTHGPLLHMRGGMTGAGAGVLTLLGGRGVGVSQELGWGQRCMRLCIQYRSNEGGGTQVHCWTCGGVSRELGQGCMHLCIRYGSNEEGGTHGPLLHMRGGVAGAGAGAGVDARGKGRTPGSTAALLLPGAGAGAALAAGVATGAGAGAALATGAAVVGGVAGGVAAACNHIKQCGLPSQGSWCRLLQPAGTPGNADFRHQR